MPEQVAQQSLASPFVRVEDGVVKIHEFEKHYITLCIKKELEKVELDVAKLLQEPSTKGMANAVVCTYVRDLKAVLERVEAMPATRW